MMLNRGCRPETTGGRREGRAGCLSKDVCSRCCVHGKEIINQGCSLLKITIMMNIEQELLLPVWLRPLLVRITVLSLLVALLLVQMSDGYAKRQR